MVKIIKESEGKKKNISESKQISTDRPICRGKDCGANLYEVGGKFYNRDGVEDLTKHPARQNESVVTEGTTPVFKDFSCTNEPLYCGAYDELPSGNPAQIYKGEYATVLVACDDSNIGQGDLTSVILDIDNGRYSFGKDTTEEEALAIGHELIKYVDDKIYNLDNVAEKFGLISY